jgi:hypothetical protein
MHDVTKIICSRGEPSRIDEQHALQLRDICMTTARRRRGASRDPGPSKRIEPDDQAGRGDALQAAP